MNSKLRKEKDFLLETNEGYTFKIIFELYKFNSYRTLMCLHPKKMLIQGWDANQSILILVNLSKSNFTNYKCKVSKYVEVTAIHCHTMLKTIKKKDGLSLYINSDNPKHLIMRPKRFDSTSNVTEKTVNINEATSNTRIKIPKDRDDPIVVPSKDFQKMLKDISSAAGKITEVTSKDGWIRFVCDNNSVYNADVTLGVRSSDSEEEAPEIEFEQSDNEKSDEEEEKKKKENDAKVNDDKDEESDDGVERVDDEDDEDNPYDKNKLYKQSFSTPTLVKLLKMAGLSKHVLIFPRENQALKFKFIIFGDDTVEILIKSTSQIAGDEDNNKNV